MPDSIFNAGPAMSKGDARINSPLRSVYTEDLAASAYGAPTIMQRGPYTLGANANVFVKLPRNIISAASASNTTLHLTSRTANHHFVESYGISGSVFTSPNISSICGFTISGVTGSGNDTGYWLMLAYR